MIIFMPCELHFVALYNAFQFGFVDLLNYSHNLINQVAGYAVGGGHVLHMVCDLTIAADNAIFGQTGPKVDFNFDFVILFLDVGVGSGCLMLMYC